MAIDAETRKPRIANVTAGLSGPAIKPIALRMVYDAVQSSEDSHHRHGRNFAAVDIIEFMLAGATASDWHRELLGSARHGTNRGRTATVVHGKIHRMLSRPNRCPDDGIEVGPLMISVVKIFLAPIATLTTEDTDSTEGLSSRKRPPL